MSFSEAVQPFIPLILGALGVLAMLPVTISLYRRFLAKPIAQRTKTTFVEAADDEEFVAPLKNTLLWRELCGETALTVQMATSRIDSIPNSIGEVVDRKLAEHGKALSANVASNLEGLAQAMDKSLDSRMSQIDEKLVKARRFGGDPVAAQEKGVESRRVNQIVQVLDDQTGGGQTMLAKARQLADAMESAGQSDLADWIDEHPDAIPKVERLIRANPRLAARLQAAQDRLMGAGGGAVRGSGPASGHAGIER